MLIDCKLFRMSPRLKGAGKRVVVLRIASALNYCEVFSEDDIIEWFSWACVYS